MCQVILTISEPVPPSENTSSAIYSDITEKAEPVPLSKNTSSAIYSDNMEKAEPVPLSKTHHQRYTPIAQKKRNQFRFPKNIISDILRQHRKSGTSSAFPKTSSAIYSNSTEKAEPVPLSKIHHQRYTPIAQKKRNQFLLLQIPQQFLLALKNR